MDENNPQYVACRNGVFILPDHLVESLASYGRGCIYLREDDEVLTISSSVLEGGQRRPLTPRFRAAMFRDAACLAIVDLHDSLRVMSVSTRRAR